MLAWLASILWYAAFAAALFALIALVKPLRRLRLAPRSRSLLVLVIAAGVVVLLARVTPAPTRVAQPRTALDAEMPVYHYNEVHSRRVNATPDAVFAAVKSVTAGEIALFRTLTTIRRFGQPGPESIMNAPERLPILDVATRGGFVLLAELPPREVVVGTIVAAPRGSRQPSTAEEFRAITDPGFVKATMNFLIEPDGNGSRVSTETRVFGTDQSAVRVFTPYWRTIFPGSWILRVSWLSAIAHRAQD